MITVRPQKKVLNQMSNPNEPYHNKGVGLAFVIIAFTMIALPVIIGTSMGWFNLFGILGL